MRRRYGLLLGCGLALFGLDAASAQDVTAGDPVGFGPKGISNTLGYRMRRGGRAGFLPSLYMPIDRADGPEVYYNPAFDGLNGTPRPDAKLRGWGFSPPWSSSYRQGASHKHAGLFGRKPCPDCP